MHSTTTVKKGFFNTQTNIFNAQSGTC